MIVVITNLYSTVLYSNTVQVYTITVHCETVRLCETVRILYCTE